MAGNKTKPTDANVEDYVASRANAQQRADCRELMALLKRVTRQSPRMWGPSIVGYGSYHYTYESGRTGEAPLAAFAIRGSALVIYLWPEGKKQRSLLSKLASTSSSLLISTRRRSKSLSPLRSRRQGGAMRRTTAPYDSFEGES